MPKSRVIRPLLVHLAFLAAVPVWAQPPSDPVVNELVANHTGTDTAEYVEVKGDPGTDYSTLTLLEIEGDGAGAGTVDAVLPVGTTDAAGYYFTGFLQNVLENGTMTILLVEGWSGAPGDDLDGDDDGTLDATPWTRVVDAVAITDGGASDRTYGVPVLAPGFDGQAPTPGGASRIPDGVDTDSASDWVRNDFDGAGLPGFVGSPDPGEAENTPGAANRLVGPAVAADPRINEFVANHTGSDVDEYLEAVGDPGVDYSSFTILEIEGDGSGAGTVDGVFPLGTTDAAGFYVTPFLANQIENGTLTLLLVEGWSGAAGDDLDVDNDGSLDAAPWTRVVDAVAVSDGGGSDRTYGVPVLDAGFDGGVFTVGGASRIPDGADTDSASDWVRNDFDGAGLPAFPAAVADAGEAINTPGAANRVAVAHSLVINEIDYDQPGTDTAEFIEIKNVSAAAIDLDPYALELVNGNGGGAVVYATIDLPAVSLAAGNYFVVCGNAATVPHCDLDVSPDTNLVQNGSPDAVALVLGGTVVDAVSYEGDTAAPFTEGSGVGLQDPGTSGNDFKGISRFPDGADSDRNNVDLVLRCITPGAANSAFDVGCTAGDGGTHEIFEIQGSGLTSPFVGLLVTTEDNVVTAVSPQGFFMQTPDERADADPETSNGIFVFTGAAPSAAVGDRVDVTGLVQEFFDLTEIGGSPVVDVRPSGSPLPAPAVFDAATPSPDQPQPATELERYEGMLVRFENGLATGPSDQFGDVAVVARGTRAFREPGIAFPGLPGLPVWDGNPEVFEIDPNGLGGPEVAIDAGTEISLAEGPLTFSFGDYQILPKTLVLGATPTLPRPVPAPAPGELTVGSLNLFRLFDDVDDPGPEDNGSVASPAEYQLRLGKLSAYVRQVLLAPDVLGVEEAESLSVLEDVAARIAADDPAVVYHPYLVEGNDIGGIDVGLLVRDDIRVDAVTQLGADETLSLDGSPLHDRPPLLLEGALVTGREPFAIDVLVVHNRSLSGIDDPLDGPRVRQKRLEQAQSIAAKIQAIQEADPAVHLVVVGDFNAYQFTDGYVDAVGQIRGDFDPAENLLSGPDLVDPNLDDQVLALPASERYSFVFDGSAQVLDHALTSAALVPLVRGMAYGRGNADAAASLADLVGSPLRVSDHDGLVLRLFADSDGDGVANAADLCPGTRIPESVPTLALGVQRWALVDADGAFDTVLPPGGGAGAGDAFTVADTGGCSCEQIIAALGLGQGHRMHGCSTGVMRGWVTSVPER